MDAAASLGCSRVCLYLHHDAAHLKPTDMATRKSYGTGEWTRSNQSKRILAARNGRGRNAAYTSGAQETTSGERGQTQAQRMMAAWNDGVNTRDVQTYTRTRNGRLSANGRDTRGAYTWTQTNRDMDGNFVRQSGRSQMASRRQRDYDVRLGLNNVSPRLIQRWRELGWLDENGNGRGGGLTVNVGAGGGGSLGLATG